LDVLAAQPFWLLIERIFIGYSLGRLSTK
jgi:hypothetical protein